MRAAAVVLVSCLMPPAIAADSLRQLYEAHRWLELREAVAANPDAGPLEAGAAAAAFHQFAAAEPLLARAASSVPADADAAREKLVNLYWLKGQYRAALYWLPQGAPGDGVRPLLQALSRQPDQSLKQSKPSHLRYELKGGNLVVPVTVNGKSARYILDTGFTNCSVSQSEARRIGLVSVDAKVTGGGSMVAGAVSMQAASAARLRIGGFEWSNVACTIAPDDTQPFADLPSGEQGIIGLPVLLTFGTWRWTAGGDMEIGGASGGAKDAQPNLWIDGLHLMTRGMLGPGALDLHVDTGATNSWMLPRFASDYTALAALGTRSSEGISQIGGSKDIASRVLPELSIGIGGFDALLKPCPILLESSGLVWAHGIVGMDILGKARAATFDFAKMTLTLE